MSHYIVPREKSAPKEKIKKETKTRWLYCEECHNTVFGSKRSVICTQAVYCLHSTMPNVSACDWVMSALCAVLLIFNFHFRYAFRPCRSARPHSGVLGRYLSCTTRTFQGNYYDLILTVKMETRNYVEGYFGSEFRVTCNHCRVMAVWSRKTWKFVEEFLRFLEKRPLTVNF